MDIAQDNIPNWLDLNPTSLCNIFSYFSIEELKILALVCRYWNEETSFLLRDKLKLNLNYFDDPSKIQALKNSKRVSDDLRIGQPTFYFVNTANILNAFPLRENFQCQYIRSLELNGFSMKQLQYIFNWMGESFENLTVGFIYSGMENTSTDDYFKIFSNLKTFSVTDEISNEFEILFKYFRNVTDLSLRHVTLDQFQKLLTCCKKVKKLEILPWVEYVNYRIEIADFEALKSLENLQEIRIKYKSTFTNMFFEAICDLNIKHTFPLKAISAEVEPNENNVRNLVKKFTNLEVIETLRNDDCFETFWNLNLKSFRGLSCNIMYLTELHLFDWSSRPCLTEISIRGTIRYDYSNILKAFLHCLPNLETISLAYLKVEISIIFEELNELNKLKSLKLENVCNIYSTNPESPKTHCLEALETLEIYSNKSAQDYSLELPKLKKLKLLHKNSLTETCLQSIITKSKNLEVEIHSDYLSELTDDDVLDFKTNLFRILSIQKLKSLKLHLQSNEDVFKGAEHFLSSTHNISLVNFEITFQINQEEFNRNITKLSKLADRSHILYETPNTREHQFSKNNQKVQLRVISAGFEVLLFN